MFRRSRSSFSTQRLLGDSESGNLLDDPVGNGLFSACEFQARKVYGLICRNDPIQRALLLDAKFLQSLRKFQAANLFFDLHALN